MNTPRTQAATLTGSIVTISHLCCQLETELDLARCELTEVQARETKAAVTLKSRDLELKAEREKVAKLRIALCDAQRHIPFDHEDIITARIALRETK